jgi:glutamine amidotransferase
MVTIIDYGMGNVGSIANMLRKLGVASVVSHSSDDIAAADRLILPGVGAFDHGMRNLRERGLVPVLEEQVHHRGTPLLGICLGMQLFAVGSEEGQEPGLGWLDATCVRLRAEAGLKVPHMGWNHVAASNGGSGWLPAGARFYFVHAYHLECRDEHDVAGRTTYGASFVSAVQRGKLTGVQFHPEKSHRFGLELLRWFAGGAC